MSPELETEIKRLLETCPYGHDGRGHVLLAVSTTKEDQIAWIDWLYALKGQLK